MAERVGFEPTVRLHAQRFSRPSQSTTLAPLHGVAETEAVSGPCCLVDGGADHTQREGARQGLSRRRRHSPAIAPWVWENPPVPEGAGGDGNGRNRVLPQLVIHRGMRSRRPVAGRHRASPPDIRDLRGMRMKRARDRAILSTRRFSARGISEALRGDEQRPSERGQSPRDSASSGRFPVHARRRCAPTALRHVIKCRRHRHGPRTGQIASDVKQAVSGVKRRAEPPTQTLLRAAAAGIRRCLFRQRNGGARDEADDVADARGNEA